jgi:hypothetical protein
MARIDIAFLLLASACLIAGVCLGIYMGVNEDLQLVAVHTHVNLVGWASLALFGVIYRLYPELAGVAPGASSILAVGAECPGLSGRDLSGAGLSHPCARDRDVSALAVGRAGILRDGCRVGVAAGVVSPGHAGGSVRVQLVGYLSPSARR